MGKVKIKHIKTPLKKYKKAIDEFQEINKERMEDYDATIHYNDSLVATINQLIIDNGLDNDLICQVFGCSGKSYAQFFTNNLDDIWFTYMVDEFSVLFRCHPIHLHNPSPYRVTSVPKWANNYWKLKYYMMYNRMILYFRRLWGDELYNIEAK